MKKHSLFWQLYTSYVWIPVLALVSLSIFASFTFRYFYYEKTTQDLESIALLFGDRIKDYSSLNESFVDNYTKRLGKLSKTRITIVLPSGKVIGDTFADPLKTDNHLNRPELKTAISGNFGKSLRLSKTLNKEHLYVAIPFLEEKKLKFIVRASISTDSINEILRKMYLYIILATIFFVALITWISYYFSKRINTPLNEMNNIAKSISRGNFVNKIVLPAKTPKEILNLGKTINTLSNELDQKLNTIYQQQNELDAALTSMKDGVLALNDDFKVIKINEPVINLLRINAPDFIGLSFFEICKTSAIQNFIKRLAIKKDVIEDEITLKEDDIILKMKGSPLRDINKNIIGCLIVFNDVTRIRKLENLRKDFVANVSHELKTPITSIKGFVETLLDGAIDNKKEAIEFLNIILNQSNRLHAIIEDLLSLSELEGNGRNDNIEFLNSKIIEILKGASLYCKRKAEKKNIEIKISCDENLEAFINPDLLEQAIINLVDNAIKYSPEGKKIELNAARDKDYVYISIKDYGIGIPSKHLPRIFERFYTVDKARSRQMGGTGLGLSIVKHIIETLNGTIDVESVKNTGSTFKIKLNTKIDQIQN